MFSIINFSRKSNFHKSKINSHFKIFLATFSLPFLLSTCQVLSRPSTGPESPESGIAQDLVTKHLDDRHLHTNVDHKVQRDLEEFSTGFEDLDYWELELELAQEMVRLNKQKNYLEDQKELRQKLINSEVNTNDGSNANILNSPKVNTWQATEGVVDALIRSGIDQQQKSKTVKRAASKSVEQRMLSAKYNRRGGVPTSTSSDYSKPRWMRLVYEMKNRKHHRNQGKYMRTQKLL